jgi:hypothetical protein
LIDTIDAFFCAGAQQAAMASQFCTAPQRI